MATPLPPLSNSALDSVVSLFRAQLTAPLDEAHVSYQLDAPNATLLIHSLDKTADGQTGKYINDASFTYGKADLGALVPYPVNYDGPWPTTYRLLSNYLNDRYGYVLEEGEFTLPGNTTATALVFSDTVDAPADPSTGEVALTATAAAGRWAEGTTLRLVLTPSNGPVELPALIDVAGSQVLKLFKLVQRVVVTDPLAVSIYLKLVGWWDWTTHDPAYSDDQPWQLIDRTAQWPVYALLVPASDGGAADAALLPDGVGGSSLGLRHTQAVNGFQGGFAYTDTETPHTSPSLNIDTVCGQELCLTTWFKTGLNQTAPIAGRQGLGGYFSDYTDRLQLCIDGDHLRFQYPLLNSGDGSTNVNLLTSTAGISFYNNVWHYAAVQIDPSSAEIYTDGVRSGLQSIAAGMQLRPTAAGPSHTQAGLIWGANNLASTGDMTFTGQVSTTVLFKKKLTAQEHAWLYNNGAGRTFDEFMAAAGF